MRRGRRRSETLIQEEDEDFHGEGFDDEMEDGGSGFFACYLLCSLSPRFKGRTYIGFTINPRRRIRQHNGELCSGARRTKSGRPWEMIVCIYGFRTKVSALQFEWAWQHPRESLAVRKAVASFKTFSGVANKLKLAYTMLTLPSWGNLNLTVNFFSTKYMKHTAGCPSLPKQMRVNVCIMNELPCYLKGQVLNNDDDDTVDVGSERDSSVDCIQSGSSEISNACNQEDANLNGMEPSNDFDILMSISDRMTWSAETDDVSGRCTPLNNTQTLGKSSDEFFRQRGLHGFTQHEEKSREHCSLSSTSAEPVEKGTYSNYPISPISCSEDPFRCFTLSSMNQLTNPSTPILDNNKKLSAPENNVIDLSTPSSFVLHPCNKRASIVHSHIIDLTNSPVCIQL